MAAVLRFIVSLLSPSQCLFGHVSEATSGTTSETTRSFVQCRGADINFSNDHIVMNALWLLFCASRAGKEWHLGEWMKNVGQVDVRGWIDR